MRQPPKDDASARAAPEAHQAAPDAPASEAIGASDAVGALADAEGVVVHMDDLEAAKEGAEAASARKSQLLADIRREIRAPMDSVLNLAQALALTSLDDHQARLVKGIQESGDALVKLLGGMLDLFRIETGALEAEKRVFSPEEVTANLAVLLTLKAREKGLDFEARVDDSARTLRLGDPARLKQVMHILLSNAVKFTEKGRIAMVVSGTPDTLTIGVADTGAGMTEKQSEHVLEGVTQADHAIRRTHGGAGLGLSIVRGVLDMLGGEIKVDSTPGVGSTFVVWLPFPVVEMDDAPAPGGSGGAPCAEDEEDAAAPETPAQRVGAEDDEGEDETEIERPLRVLSAEDNPTNRFVLQTLLKPMGVEVDFAENGRLAVDLFDPGKYDVVFMDIHMPEMSGEEAFVLMREKDAASGLPQTPIYALTADVMEDRVKRYAELGFDGCIPKPIWPKAIYSVLQAVVEGDAGSMDERFA